VKISKDDFRLIGVTKERLAVQRIREGLQTHQMVILSGSRKVGKTTALLQLAAGNENFEYFDCSLKEDIDKIYNEILVNGENMTVMIDEIQKVKECQDLLTFLSCRAEAVRSFKVVVTGSVTAFTDLLAHYKGGGRNKLVRMPIITYLEYLYFVGKIDNYDIDLTQVEYAGSFFDYMRLKGVTGLNIGPVDRDYLAGSFEDILEAKENNGLSTALLDEDENDICRAYILLAYRLACERDYNRIFKRVYAGYFELQLRADDRISESGILDSAILLKAIRSLMTDAQIAKAVRYLLWHGLAVYNYTAADHDEKPPVNLMTLYWGRSEAFEKEYIESLFAPGNSIFVVNPLLYSAISDDLWEHMRKFIEDNSRVDLNSDELGGLFTLIKQKLSSRPEGFLSDSKILGPWVECYLRGAMALVDKVMLPLIIKSLRNDSGREIDIAGSSIGTMIEVSVQQEDKKESAVNFHLFKKANEMCILTTSRNLEITMMNGVKVLKIPYYMLAAYLDRGEIPAME
jgi:hypothetical protein